MAFSRYERTPVLGFGNQYGTSITHVAIHDAVKSKRIAYKTVILHEAERLDQLAGKYYGNSRYWWVIAAASNIGWCLQVPPGTIINIPDIIEVAKIVA